MYARLNPHLGWVWITDEGERIPFVLFHVEQYNGMLTGWSPVGRKIARPRTDFDALSHDGEDWQPFHLLLALVPQETRTYVRTRDLPLPVSLDKDPE